MIVEKASSDTCAGYIKGFKVFVFLHLFTFAVSFLRFNFCANLLHFKAIKVNGYND